MAGEDLVVRHASYGLELVDKLTGAPLLGASAVTITNPPASPNQPISFLVNRSRWVFENLDGDVTFAITADFYLSEVKTTGSTLPSVPPADQPGILVAVELRPRAGYPFPRALTRAVGAVRLHESLDPAERLVPGATVTVTPVHSELPPVVGPVFQTLTGEDGQYAVWFLPQPALMPPNATSFDVVAQAIVDIAGIPTPVSGSISDQPLIPQTFNGAETIYLEL
jgi:hypothetical protein